MTNDFLKKIVNQSFDIICTITKNGEFVWVNDAVERTLGYMPKELIGKSYVQFLSAEDREKTTRTTSDIVKGIKTSTFTNTYLSKEGSEVLLVWSARWDESEALLYCVARNITEIHIAEEKIKRNEEVFRTLVKEGAYLISIINPDATYKYVSQKHAEFLGVSENELIGKTALNYVHHLDRKALNEKFKELYDVNRIETKPYRLKNKNGEWRWVQSVATNLLDKHAIEGV